MNPSVRYHRWVMKRPKLEGEERMLKKNPASFSKALGNSPQSLTLASYKAMIEIFSKVKNLDHNCGAWDAAAAVAFLPLRELWILVHSLGLRPTFAPPFSLPKSNLFVTRVTMPHTRPTSVQILPDLYATVKHRQAS